MVVIGRWARPIDVVVVVVDVKSGRAGGRTARPLRRGNHCDKLACFQILSIAMEISLPACLLDVACLASVAAPRWVTSALPRGVQSRETEKRGEVRCRHQIARPRRQERGNASCIKTGRES